MKENDRVMVSERYWLKGRAGHMGRITGRDGSRWIVEFPDPYPGGGVDGNKLWLLENQLFPLDHKMRHITIHGDIVPHTTQPGKDRGVAR